MRDLGKLICHIPARKGSKRVPAKNLRYLGGRPLIAHAVACAQATGLFDAVYVNTDSPALCALAEAYGARSYRRGDWLASDEAKGDDFTADFLEHVPCDTLLMINPVCPLVTPEDILAAVDAYRGADCDTLISCEQTRMQVFYQGRGVNIDADAALEPTQRNEPVQILNWAVTIWDSPTFLASYRASRKGYLGTRRLLFPLDPSHAVKISEEADFLLAERLMEARARQGADAAPLRYWTPDDGAA